MNTKLLMISSALLLGLIGVVLTFAPDEAAAYLFLSPNSVLVIQLLGAAYFGFAMLNWMGKGNLIGGIYSKPVSIANYAHFLVGVLAVGRLAFANKDAVYLWIITVLYGVFALLFGYVSFSNPKKTNTTT